jgi:hypothetical protein
MVPSAQLESVSEPFTVVHCQLASCGLQTYCDSRRTDFAFRLTDTVSCTSSGQIRVGSPLSHQIRLDAIFATVLTAEKSKECRIIDRYERNRIFKEAGYCFNTPRAIRAFGNVGCRYDDEKDVPLSERQRQTINQIRAAEADKPCPR